MKEEKFKVLQFIRELLIIIEEQMDNFPKKDIELKNRIRNNSYDLLELVYNANLIKEKEEKIKSLNLAVAKIKVIDFLVNLSYDKQIITAKKYFKIGNKMDDIIKYATGWINSLK